MITWLTFSRLPSLGPKATASSVWSLLRSAIAPTKSAEEAKVMHLLIGENDVLCCGQLDRRGLEHAASRTSSTWAASLKKITVMKQNDLLETAMAKQACLLN